MPEFIPFSKPDIDDLEINEVKDAIESGWITTGPKVKQFENDFQNFIGGGVHAVSVNSATAGLHLALEAIGIRKGDQVIIPTLTFTATAEVVHYLDAEVKLVDIDPLTLNISIDQLKKMITKKTKAIIVVHYAGLSCDMEKILDLAKKFNLKVVEDAAHALPSYHNNKIIGTLDSDATVFSFYANKTITTGEGGMVVSRNLNLVKRIKIMRLHGIDRDAFDRYQSKTPKWYYNVVAPGFKYNMTDIGAAIGVHQLRKLPKFHQRRQYLAKEYFKKLNNLPIILPFNYENFENHAWHLFVIRLKKEAKIDRDELIHYLSEKGIGASVHYIPLHRHSFWKNKNNLSNKMFPEAEKAYLSMLSLPLYTAMSDDDQDRVINALFDALA